MPETLDVLDTLEMFNVLDVLRTAGTEHDVAVRPVTSVQTSLCDESRRDARSRLLSPRSRLCIDAFTKRG